MNTFSLYYDAGREAQLVGYKIAGTTWGWSKVNLDELPDKVEEYKQAFKKLTGKEADVFVTANVW